MKKTAIVSCIYTNLHGTKFGGRPGRRHHYYHSIRSLLKMNDADFFIYCDPEEENAIRDHIYDIDNVKVTLIPYDISNFYMNDWFEKYKNYDEAQESVRCLEIQYNKPYWMKLITESHDQYDNYYWFDAGLSYTGLIPDKYIIPREDGFIEYFNSTLFNNDLLRGITKYKNDKLFAICIQNKDILFYRRCVPTEYYLDEKDEYDYHTIGGIFGGSKENIAWLFEQFVETSTTLALAEKQMYEEESVLNVIWRRHLNRFEPAFFDIWYHEDNVAAWIADSEERQKLFDESKSFYNILENMIELGKK